MSFIIKITLGRQATTLTTLPGFPTLAASVPTTIAATSLVNIVTPTGQTCICVPPGSCTPGTGTGDGSGLIDIRIVNNPVVSVSTEENFYFFFWIILKYFF